MQILKLTQKSNLIGAWASTLCLLHCLLTPILFIVQAGMAKHPKWWGILDIVFLIISLFAIWQSSITSSKKWMKISLWISWGLLLIIVINEKLSLFPLAEQAIYIPTVSLVFLHLYNQKYCKCSDDSCCTKL